MLHRDLQHLLDKCGLINSCPPKTFVEWDSFLREVSSMFAEQETLTEKFSHAVSVASDEFQETRASLKQKSDEAQESQALYASLVACIPLSVFRVALNGTYEFANSRYCRRLHKSDESEIVGKTYRELFPKGLADKFRKEDLDVIEKKRLKELTDSSIPNRCLHVWKSPIFGDNGDVVGVQGISWDITATRQEERDLKRKAVENEEKYRILFQCSKDAISFTTENGDIVAVNQSMVDRYGYTKKELLSMNAATLYSNPSDRKEFQDFMRDEHSTNDFEVKLKTKTRTHLDICLTATAIYNDRKEISGYAAIHHDVTKRNQREDELKAKNINYQEGLNLGAIPDELLGQSGAMRRIMATVRQIAPSNACVLLTGETGTGKTSLAFQIHKLSGRSGQFVTVKCGAMEKERFANELFGHARGGFSSADRDSMGRFEVADRGTIFFDEIGVISEEMQEALLHVVQFGEFERIGDTRTKRVDVRIIAATNHNLKDENKFRKDLYHRISTLNIEGPPLRNRLEDIHELANYFATKFFHDDDKEPVPIANEGYESLRSYNWPGNIRELEKVIKGAVVFTKKNHKCLNLTMWSRNDGGVAGSELRPTIEEVVERPIAVPRPMTMNEAKVDAICAALVRSHGVVAGQNGAAKVLDLPPSTLTSMMKKLEIKRPRVG